MTNKPAKEDVIAWLAYVADAETVHSAVVDSSCPEVALNKALELFPEELNQIAYNAEAPSALLELAYFSERVHIFGKSNITEHKNATEKILSEAINDDNESVRVAAAGRVQKPEHIEFLARDKSQRVRQSLAKNTCTPSEILKVLLNPYSRNIGAFALENPNCTSEIFDYVAEQPFVHKDDSEITGYWVIEPLLTKAPQEKLKGIFDRVPQVERHHVLKNPNSSLEMIESALDGAEIIYDNKSLLALLKRNDLTDEILQLAMKKVSRDFLPNFAYYPFITPKTVEALIALKSKEINLALIRNQHLGSDSLMPLIKVKSVEVLKALAGRTYFGIEEKSGKYADINFMNRGEVWEAVDAILNKEPRFDISLYLYALPYSQSFSPDDFEWLVKDDAEITNEKVVELLYSNDEEVCSAVIPRELFQDFERTAIRDLIDFLYEEDNQLWPQWAMFETEKLEDYGLKVIEFSTNEDGDLEVYYCKWVQINFTLKAPTVADAMQMCVSNVPKFMQIWEQTTDDAYPIYRMVGSAGKHGGKYEVIDEEWYLNDSLL